MADIQVSGSGRSFVVEVKEKGSSTTHDVSVPDGFESELGLAEADLPRLVEESFRFMLEREPKESILPSFELTVIGRYFPEYQGEIARRLG